MFIFPKLLMAALLCMFLSACMSYQSVRSTFDFKMLTSIKLDALYELPSELTHTKSSAEMRAFLLEVLDSNLDLKAIAANVKAARYSVSVEKVNRLPRADFSLSHSREKSQLLDKPTITKSALASVDIGWTFDVWGKLADETSVSVFFSQKAHYQYLQLQKELILQSSHSWIDYWYLKHLEKNYNQLSEIYTQLDQHFSETYSEGLTSYQFLVDARNNKERGYTRLFEARLEMKKIAHYLNALRGHAPNEAIYISNANLPISLVSFDQGIPATQLKNRPDVLMAFAELQAIEQSAKAAHKALLPQLTLNGTLTKNGDTVAKVFSGNLLWQLVGGITQPLFNGGQLQATAKQRSAQAESAWWQYQASLLNAFLEVEDALSADRLLVKQLKHKRLLVDSLTQRINSIKERFTEGELSVSDYLQMKANMIEEKNGLVRIQAQYIKNRVTLMIAIGLSPELGVNPI